MCKHLGISALTGNKFKGDDDFVIKEHLLFSSHPPNFEDFSILTTNNNESLLVNRDHSPSNSNISLRNFLIA